ncbi:MAG: aspartate kinase [Archaeoglobi archaeon]|nr:aspartate kinase [Candidatus Mnemosynella bozhongmuii]
MRIAMKFGGTSVADGERIRHVASLVKSYENDEVVVTVSALSGVTDALIEIAQKASKNGKVSEVKEFVSDLLKRHHETANSAIKDEKIREEVIEEVDSLLEDLERVLTGICYIGELTERSLDYIVSFGERLSAPIVSGALRDLGSDSLWMTGGEAGIITDDNFGSARPLPDVYERIREKILPLLGERIPVVTGFIGETEEGQITTLGRGGSDYTNSLIGAAIDADEIWFWKEVDGVMTADPKIVKDARTIPELSYAEVMEMSYFGAKILHPRAVEPAMEKNIPIRVKNTFNPSFEGTVIKRDVKSEEVVKAVTLIKNVVLLNFFGAGMVGVPKVASSVFEFLAENDCNIIMISQGSSEANISVLVDSNSFKRIKRGLKKFSENGFISSVSFREEVSAVAAVGSGMVGVPGVAGRLFSAVGRRGINIIMISQGSSEHNISFVVSERDAEEAVRAVHDEFIGGKK